MAKCVICEREVPCGPALLVMEGELRGGQKFEAKSAAGPACQEHLGEGSAITEGKFPVVFQL